MMGYASQMQSMDAFWCDAKYIPQLGCLDIASASTMNGVLNVSAYQQNIVTGLYSPEFLNENYTSSTLFGQTSLCNGLNVSDGIVNVFDVSTLMAYIFSEGLYGNMNRDPRLVDTVSTRPILYGRCGSAMTRSEYVQLYVNDQCDGSGRRLLEYIDVLSWSPTSVPVERGTNQNWHVVQPLALPTPIDSLAPMSFLVDNQANPHGSWMTVAFGAMTFNVEMKLNAFIEEYTDPVVLSNYRFVPSDAPTVPEVRFTRSCVNCDAECASILTMLPHRIAISDNVMSLMQRPFTMACPFEVHTWVPTQLMKTGNASVEYIIVSDGVQGSVYSTGLEERESPPSSPGVVEPPEDRPPEDRPPASSFDIEISSECSISSVEVINENGTRIFSAENEISSPVRFQVYQTNFTNELTFKVEISRDGEGGEDCHAGEPNWEWFHEIDIITLVESESSSIKSFSGFRFAEKYVLEVNPHINFEADSYTYEVPPHDHDDVPSHSHDSTNWIVWLGFGFLLISVLIVLGITNNVYDNVLVKALFDRAARSIGSEDIELASRIR